MAKKPPITQGELERGLGDYYAHLPTVEGSEMKTDLETLVRARRRPVWNWQGLQLVGAIGAAAIVIGLIVVPLMLPAGQTSDVGAQETGGKFVPQAPVNRAGLVRSGGFWAARSTDLVVSTDAGETWVAWKAPIPSAAVQPLVDVSILDAKHGWVLTLAQGTSLSVSATTDGGESWTTNPAPPSCAYPDAHMAFSDAASGFLACGSPSGEAIYRTRDGGKTWSAWTTCGPASSLTASDAATVWLGSPDAIGPAAMLQLGQEGVGCRPVSLPQIDGLSSGAALSVPIAPQTTGPRQVTVPVSVDINSGRTEVWFFETEDLGQTWSIVKRPVSFQFSGLAEVAEGPRLVTVALRHLSASDDLGKSWTEFDASGIPSDKGFTWLGFSDKSHAAAIVFLDGSGDQLLVSSDGGKNWLSPRLP